MRRPCFALCLLLGGIWPAAPSRADGPSPCAAAEHESEGCRRESLIEAAWRVRLVRFLVSPLSPLEAYEPQFDTSWLSEIWRKHRYHFLGVFLMEEAEYLYEDRIGPPAEPRFFADPGSLDQAVLERFEGRRQARTFIAKHKEEVVQATALTAILLADRRDRVGLVDDLIGLVEAHKFNWATSSLLKTFVGRPRPAHASLQADAGASRDARDSFPSDVASTAFTFMAYTDSVVARRLKGRPWARALSAAGLYGLASYVAYTRVEQGRHYLTDVVAGAGAGFAVGKTFHRLHHNDRRDDEEARVEFTPFIVPGGGGAAVTFRFGRVEPP